MKRLLAFVHLSVLAACALVALAVPPAAAERISFIRDTEIENTILTWATPLFEAAGLQPDAIQIYIVNDRSLNAFVAGGQKLFINTGLLMASENADQVIGVIAHETGHIAGGHLARTHDALRDSTATSILAFVLGGLAAIASQRPDLGAAIIAGGQSAGLRNFLQYSRTQEYAADQAAMKFLDETHTSAKGLLDFMHTLSGQDLLSTSRQDPYMRTHPMTRDRIAALEQHVATSPYSKTELPAEYDRMHRVMRAKLFAFMEPGLRTLRRYPETDNSEEARLARAIAFYRRPDLDRALPLVDGLIAEFPDNPFYHELRGQMLFENGRVKEALPAYREAVRLLPKSPLLRRAYGHVQLEMNDPALLPEAIENLRTALAHDRTDAFAWRQLAIAYGRDGQTAQGALALAEEAMLQGRHRDAIYHAGKAERELPRGSSGWLQAQDLLAHAEQAKERAKARGDGRNLSDGRRSR
ncbi:MAG: M48 family metallopeptidase [Hyphomicrobiales bacterium]|nr:M48 family metallopeptidase [Hyphomicrobiales bacterium]